MSTSAIDRAADVWWQFVTASVTSGFAALVLVLVIWMFARRWMLPQVGCWLFLLVMLKATIPLGVPVQVERPEWFPVSLAENGNIATAVQEPGLGASPRQEVADSEQSIQAQASFPAKRWLMFAWAVVVSFGLARLAWIAARTRRIRQLSEVMDPAGCDFAELKAIAGAGAHVELRVSDHLYSPAACGLFRPCVLVPRGLFSVLSTEQMRWAMLHELFHIRRRDLWVSAGQEVLRVILFFNPAIWIADRMVSTLREQACDDAAVVAGGMDSRESALGLLRLAEWISSRPSAPVPVLALFNGNAKHQLRHRLMKLKDPLRSRSPRLGWRGSIAVCVAAIALIPSLWPAELGAQEAAALREKVAALEKRIAEMEQGQTNQRRLERLLEDNRQKARKRAAEDSRHYKPAELKELESLYQVANRNWRSDEAKQSLKELLSKYDKSNRTGCATLYMGQMSEGAERLEYLTRAVEKFSDCFYLDGCQVGGYGRYVLALTLWESGDKEKAKQLFQEIRQKYKDAIDHRGRPMIEIAEAAEKELGISKG